MQVLTMRSALLLLVCLLLAYTCEGQRRRGRPRQGTRQGSGVGIFVLIKLTLCFKRVICFFALLTSVCITSIYYNTRTNTSADILRHLLNTSLKY